MEDDLTGHAMTKIDSLEDLLKMKLHEQLEYSNMIVFRVLGGWIYTTKCNDKISSVFVSDRNGL